MKKKKYWIIRMEVEKLIREIWFCETKTRNFNYIISHYFFPLKHLSMLSPRGVGEPGIFGAFDLYCHPHPREFALRNGTKSHHPCAHLCVWHLGTEVVQLKPWKRAVFNRGKRLFLYFYKTLLLSTQFLGGYIWSDLNKFWGPTVGI